jgi:ABC-2 type transport system ATP-binding protein
MNRPTIPSGVLFLFLFMSVSSVAQVLSDVSIQVSDGQSLEATIVTPTGLPPAGGFPALVLVHGFGGSKTDMHDISLLLALTGYASLAYSVRGQGNSGGLSTINGERERQDLLEVLQYLQNVSSIDPNRLGVTGGSQGGIHSWMAAAYRMPGVKAVVPLIATPDFASSLTPNGCIKYGLPRELVLGSVRYSGDRDRVRGFIVADEYDSVRSYIDARDLIHLVDSIQIPVLQGMGWADFLFPVNGGIRAAGRLAQRGIPTWSYYGTNSHGEATDTTEFVYLLQKTVIWFDHWLKGAFLDQDSVPMTFYSDDRPGWPHHTTTAWPPQPSNTLRLYITRDGLSTAPKSESAILPFSISYDSNYTSSMAWDDRYGGPSFLNAFASTSSRRISVPLAGEIEITGVPSGSIVVQSDAAKFQAHVEIYDVMDVDTGQVWRFMSRSINGIRKNSQGETHQVAIEATALSHIVPAGHRIGVEVTSLDMLSDGQANTVPYFNSSHSQLLTSASTPSYVELPVVGSLPAAVAEQRLSIPRVASLSQNFPNPFNPATGIRYTVPKASWVTLTVYDILGREVGTLVDAVKAAGTYAASFDGSRVTSGVYFCRFHARAADGSQPTHVMQTIKMILTK